LGDAELKVEREDAGVDAEKFGCDGNLTDVSVVAVTAGKHFLEEAKTISMSKSVNNVSASIICH
jgi:hypothetical protein